MSEEQKQPTLIDIETQAVAIRQEMTALAIVDQPTYDLVVTKRTEAVQWLKKAEAFFDPAIADAHSLHKKLLAQKASVVDPTKSAIARANSALVAWDHEQERIRRQKQLEIEEQARREAEEQRLADAIQMEAQGAPEEVVNEVIAAPVIVHTPVVAAPTYEKSKAVQFRDNWSGVCDDLFKLVQAVAKDKSKLNLLMVNQPALNAMAKGLKESMAIPGCRAVNNRIAATGRG